MAIFFILVGHLMVELQMERDTKLKMQREEHDLERDRMKHQREMELDRMQYEREMEQERRQSGSTNARKRRAQPTNVGPVRPPQPLPADEEAQPEPPGDARPAKVKAIPPERLNLVKEAQSRGLPSPFHTLSLLSPPHKAPPDVAQGGVVSLGFVTIFEVAAECVLLDKRLVSALEAAQKQAVEIGSRSPTQKGLAPGEQARRRALRPLKCACIAVGLGDGNAEVVSVRYWKDAPETRQALRDHVFLPGRRACPGRRTGSAISTPAQPDCTNVCGHAQSAWLVPTGAGAIEQSARHRPDRPAPSTNDGPAVAVAVRGPLSGDGFANRRCCHSRAQGVRLANGMDGVGGER